MLFSSHANQILAVCNKTKASEGSTLKASKLCHHTGQAVVPIFKLQLAGWQLLQCHCNYWGCYLHSL